MRRVSHNLRWAAAMASSGTSDDALDPLLRDGEHQLADALGGEGIGGDAAGFGVDRVSGFESAIERGAEFRFDADDADATLIPAGDAADQAAAAAGDQQRIDRAGACSSNSRPTEPAPCRVSTWSYAWTFIAPDCAAHSSLAIRASL